MCCLDSFVSVCLTLGYRFIKLFIIYMFTVRNTEQGCLIYVAVSLASFLRKAQTEFVRKAKLNQRLPTVCNCWLCKNNKVHNNYSNNKDLQPSRPLPVCHNQIFCFYTLPSGDHPSIYITLHRIISILSIIIFSFLSTINVNKYLRESHTSLLGVWKPP